MSDQRNTHISKLLSLVLRHSPETIGISLDAHGWVRVEDLLKKLADYNEPLTATELEVLVANSNKQRFAFDEGHNHIRANQGHSIDIDLQLKPVPPPEFLYHGTTAVAIEGIKANGLQKMQRQHVHLSASIATAEKVGMRHGKPWVLVINSGELYRSGHVFYLSANGVWLSDHIPVAYINFNHHEK